MSQQKERLLSGSEGIERPRRSTILVEKERSDGMKVVLVDGDSCTSLQTMQKMLQTTSALAMT